MSIGLKWCNLLTFGIRYRKKVAHSYINVSRGAGLDPGVMSPQGGLQSQRWRGVTRGGRGNKESKLLGDVIYGAK